MPTNSLILTSLRRRRLPLLAVAAVTCVAGVLGCDDGPAPEPFVCTLQNGAVLAFVGEEECAKVEGLALPSALPAPRGNAYGDDDSAADLGFKIFYDARFSSNANVRCASCHLPEKAFADAEQTSVDGVGDVSRNSPTTLNAAYHKTFFWGGRADSLWSQPLFALEAPNEMDFTRLETVHTVARLYGDDYADTFGDLPSLDDTARFPRRGKPGDVAWDQMTVEDQDTINRAFANVGKALAAFMRRAVGGQTRLDAFLAGDRSALTETEQQGLAMFAAVGCIDCHSGPLLSDEKFYNLGLATGETPDLGRAVGATVVLENEFSLFGPYADAFAFDLPDPEALKAEAASEKALGAIRTPSLRHVGRTAPYGHHGKVEKLEEIVDYHLQGGQVPEVGVLTDRLKARILNDSERLALLEFLRSLDVTSPNPPWNDWPER